MAGKRRLRGPGRAVSRDGTGRLGSARNGVPCTAAPEIRLEGLEKRYGDVRRRGRRLARHRRRRVLLAPRPVGLRQDHDAADGRRLRAARRRAGSCCAAATSPRSRPTSAPVNMVFQSYALFPHLTVGDNVAFGPQAQGLAKDEVRRRVGEALDARPARRATRSAPEPAVRRPAAAGRARPRAREPARRAAPRRAARRARPQAPPPAPGRAQAHPAEVGITFVYVTHDQEEALTMSDRIAVMNAGRVEQLGHARGALRAARDPVRRRLHRHDQPARGRRRRGRRLRRASTTGERGRRRRSTATPPGAAVEIGVRPESIRSCRRLADGALPARVEQAAYLGTSVSYLVRTTGGTASASSPRRPGPGSRSAATSPSPGSRPMRSCSAWTRRSDAQEDGP